MPTYLFTTYNIIVIFALVGLSLAAAFQFRRIKALQALLTQTPKTQPQAATADFLETEIQARTAELRDEVAESHNLLNIICHDLASPMTVLEYHAKHLAPKINQDETTKKSYAKVTSSINMLNETLQRVRRLQKTRLGKSHVNLEPLDPISIVEELCLFFEDRLLEKDLHVNIESYLGKSPMLMGDRALLKTEVLANILSNAIKFSPCSRNIDLCLLNENDQIVINIRDYGIGIPKEMIHNIFDLNSNTHRLGTNAEPGTGFGLPLAKSCLRMMDGSIAVESFEYVDGVSGPGTLFTLRLKAAPPAGPSTPSMSQ